MLSFWDEFERPFGVMDELRRQMNRVLDEHEGGERNLRSSSFPIEVFENDNEFILRADVPGMESDRVNLTLNWDVLGISVQRSVSAPEGFSAHRRERGDFRAARTVTFPTRVDPEKVRAELVDGVLTVNVAKAEESRPRRITVQAR
jgi:HSP20 family protein